MLYQQKHCQLGPKGTKREQNESKLLDPQNSAGRKQADKTIQLQTHVTSHEKEKMAQKMEPQAQMVEPWTQRLELRAPEDYFQTLKPSGICLDGFLHFGEPVTLFLSISSLFKPEYLCLSYLFWGGGEENNLFL